MFPLGDVMHLKVLSHNIIVLNSVEAATDLLEKRSALYSDRPTMTVYVEWVHRLPRFYSSSSDVIRQNWVGSNFGILAVRFTLS